MAEIQVTILIPCYNEERSIAHVINDISTVMQKTDYVYEIMVVDDSSTDRTLLRIPEVPHLRVVVRSNRAGSGAARKTGIRAALGSIIVMLDGDDTYDARSIPRLLHWFPKYDQVNGMRTTEEGGMKMLRRPVKWAIRKFASVLTGHDIPDLNTGFKAFKREQMLKYEHIIPNGFSCVSTMSLAFITNNHKVKYIPTTYYERIGRSKFNPIQDTFRYIRTIIRVVYYFRGARNG